MIGKLGRRENPSLDNYMRNLLREPAGFVKGSSPKIWAHSALPLYQELTCLVSQVLLEEAPQGEADGNSVG